MHYSVTVKKPANEKTRENSYATVNMAKLRYITGARDMGRASDTEIKQLVKDELRKGVELDPEYELKPVEYIVVMPNKRKGGKRRQLGKAIYKGDIEIPQEAIRKHRKKRKQRGYQ